MILAVDSGLAAHSQSHALGILDFGIRPGIPAGRVLLDMIDAAEIADNLGFSRYWLGEHHNIGIPFGPSPEILLPILGGVTSHLRIGAGAVLLNYYSPLKVANSFKILAALFPGRIDLGVGQGTADRTDLHLALADGRDIPRIGYGEGVYNGRCATLLGLLREAAATDQPTPRPLPVNPPIEAMPEVWLCGGRRTAMRAATLGASFCMSLFHGAGFRGRPLASTAIDDYRRNFNPTGMHSEPQAMIAICGACTESDDTGHRLQDRWNATCPNFPPTVIGPRSQWDEVLAELREHYDVDEIMVLDAACELPDRIRSMELLADLTKRRLPEASLARR